MQATGKNEKLAQRAIIAVSIAIPVVVAVLLFIPKPQTQVDVSFLPLVHACINSAVAVLLVAGYVFIRRKNIPAHRACMTTALGLSLLFLLSYVTYHTLAPSTKFGGVGAIRYVYFFVLLTHIVLAAAIVPLALFTVYRAWSNDFARHKKIARYTFPLWLYVAITGVVVYLMISPYYAH
jgi:putative membrane protein